MSLRRCLFALTAFCAIAAIVLVPPLRLVSIEIIRNYWIAILIAYVFFGLVFFTYKTREDNKYSVKYFKESVYLFHHFFHVQILLLAALIAYFKAPAVYDDVNTRSVLLENAIIVERGIKAELNEKDPSIKDTKQTPFNDTATAEIARLVERLNAARYNLSVIQSTPLSEIKSYSESTISREDAPIVAEGWVYFGIKKGATVTSPLFKMEKMPVSGEIISPTEDLNMRTRKPIPIGEGKWTRGEIIDFVKQGGRVQVLEVNDKDVPASSRDDTYYIWLKVKKLPEKGAGG
ncbi:MAG: hypothetical protein HQL44_08835 [Alphaproteobacteria bacterium]|nr:hypothetical protein [Alphaproteobacteria bacterium]